MRNGNGNPVLETKRPAAVHKDGKTPLGALADLGRDIQLLVGEYKGLMKASSMHSSMRVMLSALDRCRDSLRVLIESEEREGSAK